MLHERKSEKLLKKNKKKLKIVLGMWLDNFFTFLRIIKILL